MATQVSTKVRLVRCPKCREVLAELPDVRLYKCGGCGTVLQAKMRNAEANRTESTDSVASLQQDNAPEEEEARSSNHDLSSLQNGDSLKENGDIDHQYEHLDSKTASPEGNSCEVENSTAEVKDPSRHDDEVKESASDTNHDLNDHKEADNSEVVESQRLCQEGDDVVDRDENIPENSHQENDRPSVGESQRLCQEGDDVVDRDENIPENSHQENDRPLVGESQRLCQEGDYVVDRDENIPENSHQENDRPSVGESQRLCQEGDYIVDRDENIPENSHQENDRPWVGESQRLCQEGDDVVDRDENIPENSHQENDRPWVGESQRLCQEGDYIVDRDENIPENSHQENDRPSVGESQRLCQEGDDVVDRDENIPENSHQENDWPSVGESQRLCQEGDNVVDRDENIPGNDRPSVGESQRLCQEGDDVVDRDANIPVNSHQENYRPSIGGENGEGRRHRHVSLEKEEKACSAEENGGLHGEVGHVGSDSSSAQILSHGNVDASQLAEPSMEIDGDLEKKLSATAEDSSVESHDYGHLHRPVRKFRQNFGSASSVSTLGSSPPVKRPTSALSIKHGDVRSNFPTTRNYYGYDGSESSYDDDQRPKRISHPSRRNGTTVQKLDAYNLDEMLSSEPRMNYSNLPFNDTSESPSIYKRNLIPRHPGFRSLDDKPDEMELLRTVQDLKDQLDRIQILRAERQIYADASPPRYHHLHNQERRNVSRLAFSGEAAHFRHQINCSCLHCCPQDLHRLAQLPSGYCGVHTGCSHCNVSSFSTPEHYTSSELSPWTREMQIDDLRHRDREMQRLLREKYHTARRHIRPMAGGAPVVPCYHCSELLQLPAEFLLSKKRYHQLKCGACGKMLSFSLLRNKHIVPHLPEADNQRKFGSTSDSAQHVDHVSRDQSDRNKNRKMSSGSSYDLTRDTRMKSIVNKDMDLVESSYGSVGASSGKSKAESSESEKIKALAGSRLHRLMGYGSARHVLNK